MISEDNKAMTTTANSFLIHHPKKGRTKTMEINLDTQESNLIQDN
jgi:hypothetical protein